VNIAVFVNNGKSLLSAHSRQELDFEVFDGELAGDEVRLAGRSGLKDHGHFANAQAIPGFRRQVVDPLSDPVHRARPVDYGYVQTFRPLRDATCGIANYLRALSARQSLKQLGVLKTGLMLLVDLRGFSVFR